MSLNSGTLSVKYGTVTKQLIRSNSTFFKIDNCQGKNTSLRLSHNTFLFLSATKTTRYESATNFVARSLTITTFGNFYLFHSLRIQLHTLLICPRRRNKNNYNLRALGAHKTLFDLVKLQKLMENIGRHITEPTGTRNQFK